MTPFLILHISWGNGLHVNRNLTLKAHHYYSIKANLSSQCYYNLHVVVRTCHKVWTRKWLQMRVWNNKCKTRQVLAVLKNIFRCVRTGSPLKSISQVFHPIYIFDNLYLLKTTRTQINIWAIFYIALQMLLHLYHATKIYIWNKGEQ